MANPILEATGPEEAGDGELPDGDQDLWLEDVQFGVEPVRAVGNRRGRGLEVAVPGAVTPGEAAHERGDVAEVPQLLASPETSPHQPPVPLLPPPTRNG